MGNSEYHVASFVVSAHARDGQKLAAEINAMHGLEVHVEEQGKLVVTAEARNVRELADIATSLERVDSVIAVAPVYHEYDGKDQGAASTPREKE